MNFLTSEVEILAFLYSIVKVKVARSFPKNTIYDPGIGEGYCTTSNSHHLVAMFL